MAKLDVVRDLTRPLEEETSLLLKKPPLKRNAPGEGEARAAELNDFLDTQIIPAVSGVITAYRELVTIADVDVDTESTAEADSTVVSSDSEGDDES